MNFRGAFKEDPEINLIPMIDVLLVILIFLMITTTYSKFAELQINLPSAQAEKQAERANEINVTVNASGQYTIDRKSVTFGDVTRPRATRAPTSARTAIRRLVRAACASSARSSLGRRRWSRPGSTRGEREVVIRG